MLRHLNVYDKKQKNNKCILHFCAQKNAQNIETLKIDGNALGFHQIIKENILLKKLRKKCIFITQNLYN